MTSVGDVIQPGQVIPDDVTEFKDNDDDHWWRGEDGLFAFSGHEWFSGEELAKRTHWWPLTVTAVREQPAIEVVATSTVGGAKVPVYAVREQPGEPEPIPERQCGREDSHGGHLWKLGAEWRCEGFTGRAGVPAAAPELQQADASPVLDLVRRFGIERYSLGYNVGQGDTAAATRDEAKASALHQQIVAVAPPYVQARDAEGEQLWIFGCGHVEASPRPPTFDHCTRSDAAPWLPLLVGGDPAPESGILAHARKALHERDKAIAQLNQMQENAEAWQRERDETIRRVNHLTVELAATQQMLDVMTAQPDPLVLSLPEVPEGTEALTGIESGRRYARGTDSSGETVWAAGIIGGTLGEVLDGEPDGVRVELALPREPRTWPKLDDAPDGVSKVEVRRPDGTQFVCARRRDGNWAATIAFADPESAEPNETFTWGELLGEGDVTEVTE